MEPKGSLLVPSVQELAKQPLVSVPPRYVRPDFDPPMMLDENLMSQVPVVDMQKLLDPASMDSELSHLRFACKKWGFFQLVNHGVSSSLLEKLKLQVQDFFNLSKDEKKKFWQYPGEREGFGHDFIVSENQKLDWADRFNLVTLPAHLRKPHLFPNLPLPFRETLEAYSSEVNNLTVFIIEQIGKTLNIQPKEVKYYVEGMRQSIGINYYPPCPQQDKVIGLSPHSDASMLTILIQVNEIQGLEIRKDGKWIPIMPLPDAFIINIGNFTEIMTNGAYQSIEHRVTVNSLNERISIAAFQSPSVDRVLTPIPSLISEQTPALFKSVRVQEYFESFFSRELRGKSFLDNFRIQGGKD